MEKEENKNIKKPHVEIFNEDIDSWVKVEKESKNKKKDFVDFCHVHCHEKKNISSGIFGLLVLFVGVLFLFNTLGIASKEIWNYVLPFWPVILILVGLKIIAGFSKILSFFVFLLTLALFCCILLYALIHVGSPLVDNLHLPQEFINFIGQLN